MDTTELILLLSEVPGIGDKTLAAVLRRCAVTRRTPEELLRQPAQALVDEYGMRSEAAAAVAAMAAGGSEVREAASAARAMRRCGVQALTLLDAVYPARLLEQLDVPPPVLYAYGRLDLLNAPLFAVANSNGAPEEALEAGDRAAAVAMEAGWAPVTGHNRQAYQRPALVARRNGGRVCYVLDRGMIEAFGGDFGRELFPAARIWSPAYDPDCDLTLSPFPLRAHSLAAHNRRRDDLIFALARAVLVGAVRPGGQMERLALDSLGRGVPVCLVGPPADGDADLVTAGAMRTEHDGRLAQILAQHAAQQ